MSLQQRSNDTPPRVGRLMGAIAEQKVDVLVALKPEVTFYLTGFTPIIYSKPVIVIVAVGREPILLVNALRDELARTSPWVKDIRLYGNWFGKPSMGSNWDVALEAILSELGVSDKTVGIEGNFVTANVDNQLRKALPNATFVDVSSLINQCRTIKDDDEIANARIAAKIADVGIRAAVQSLGAGGTEQEACIASMREMNAFWVANYPDVKVCTFGSLESGQHNGLETWILSGPRKFLCCDVPTSRKPQIGETVSLFVWTVANGMRAEVERTVRIGGVAVAERNALQAVREIREEVGEMMKPGTPVGVLYEIARKGYEKHGFGNLLPGRIGHSIGLGNHEDASIGAGSSLVLMPGMILTLEPHIQVPATCSTQFSDTILITPEGHEYLNTPPNYEELEVNPPMEK